MRAPVLASLMLGLCIWAPVAAVGSAAAEEGPQPPATATPQASATVVQQFLRRHCATCHGSTAQERGRGPVALIGGIDDLDWLASSAYVIPGDPDASRIFAVVQERHAPLEHFKPWGQESGPTAGDVRRLRDWIAELTPDPVDRCRDGRVYVSNRQIARSVLSAASAAGAGRAIDQRYLSLAHIWNACGTRDRLRQLLRATEEALNGLSWRPDKFRLDPVPFRGRDGSPLPPMVFAVDLGALGIPRAIWDKAALASSIATTTLTGRLRSRLTNTFGTAAAIVAADAFLSGVYTSAATYREVLRLPRSPEALARRLGISEELLADPSHILDVAQSRITSAPRRLSRYRSRTTTLWFAQPGADAASDVVPQVRALFRLPNELPAFAVFGDEAASESVARSPASCAACHSDGPLLNRTPGDRAALDPVVVSQQTMSFSAFAAEVAADVLPVPRFRGLDAISTLIAEHSAPVDLRRAAAELGQRPAVLTGILSERIASGDWIARRLSQGQISRAQFQSLRKSITGGTAAVAVEDASARPRTSLAVWTDREVYEPGADLRISIRAARQCFPTLIHLDANGEALVLYPNGLDEARELAAGETLTLPATDAAYAIRTRRTGARASATTSLPSGPGEIQRLVALCSETDATLFAIRPDYTQQVFTILGDWNAFIASAYTLQAEAEDPVVLKRRQDEARRRNWRLRRRKREPIYDARPRRLMRATATFEVR